MQNSILEQIKKSYETKIAIYEDEKLVNKLEELCNLLINTYKNNGKTLLAGNGGSAADAQHIAAELVARFYFDRPALSSIALTTDTSIITAIGNDYGYDDIFSRQIEANGQKDDVFIAISTSGNSSNLIKALKQAKQKGVICVGFLGKDGGEMKDLCDISLIVPSYDTPRIQESHILFGHIICQIVEEKLFPDFK